MGKYKQPVITTAGYNLIAQAVSGGASVEWTTMQTSTYIVPDGADIAAMTSLQDVMQTASITSSRVYDGDVVQVSANFENSGITTEYLVQTLGVFARVASAAPVLVAVVCAEDPDSVPAFDINSPASFLYNLQLTISGASAVTFAVNPTGTATVQDISDIREDLSALSDHVDVVEDALNSTPFVAERVFRKVALKDSANRTSVASQTMTSTASTIICAGRILMDDSEQRIDEYDLSGNLIRTQMYANTALGHMNDITYDPDRGLLYVAGTGHKVVVIKYADLTVQETHTISNMANTGAIAYADGVLYAGAGSSTGVIDMDTWTYTQKLLSNLSVANQNYNLVRQGMAVHGDYMYIVYNRNNQLLKVNIKTWTIETSITIGKGNGTYPYGEVEGVTFVGEQLWISSAVWFDGYIDGTYEGSILQVFKTNIGGVLAQHNNIGQPTGGVSTTVYVNGTDTDSTALNPNGTTAAPFYSLLETCAYLNYQSAINPNVSWSIQINPGNNHDYSKDVFLLSNMTVYIRGMVVVLRTIALRNCIAFVRQVTLTGALSIRYSNVRISLVTSPKVSSTYSTLIVGPSCTIDAYELEGTSFYPYNFDDIKKRTSIIQSELRYYPYTSTTLTSEYLAGSMTIDRFGRTAVLSYLDSFELPVNSRTVIGTLPAEFKPVRQYVYDLVDYNSADKLRRLRVTLNTDGTIDIYNYSSVETSFVNMRLHMTYITVATS